MVYYETLGTNLNFFYTFINACITSELESEESIDPFIGRPEKTIEDLDTQTGPCIVDTVQAAALEKTEEELSFHQKKVFWEARASAETSPVMSPARSDQDMFEEITPEKKEHFETFVKPSLEDTNTEAEDLEHKAIPSEKLETPIDQDQLITRQIKDGILDMELEEGDEPVMTDSWIEKRSSSSSLSQQQEKSEFLQSMTAIESQFDSSSQIFKKKEEDTTTSHQLTDFEAEVPAAEVTKRQGISFVDVPHCTEQPPETNGRVSHHEGAHRAAEQLVETIKHQAVLIAEEIRNYPYEFGQEEESEVSSQSGQDNNIETVREVASDFVSALTTRAIELAERMGPMLTGEASMAIYQATDGISEQDDSEELEVNEIISYHDYSYRQETEISEDFCFQTSFRAHFVTAFDENFEFNSAEVEPPLSREPLETSGSKDEFSEDQHSEGNESSKDKHSEDQARFESSDDKDQHVYDINEDIWAEQSKVTYRKKMLMSSTSSSIKKMSDTESSSKICDRRSGTDFESSSTDNFQTAQDRTPGISRPSSSDVEVLLSTVSHRSSDLTTDYDTAQTSHHDSSYRSCVTTSGEYHTAVSSLMSEESLKSIDESSGNLGSIEVSEARSDTLRDAQMEFDRESLNTPIGAPHEEETVPTAHMAGSILLGGSPDTDTEDSSFVSQMVRSAEMIFYPEPHTLRELSGQAENEEEEEEEENDEEYENETEQIKIKHLSESRETLSASVLTISSNSEVTILHPQQETPELRVQEDNEQGKKIFQLSESSSSSASEKAIQSATPQTGSCDFLSSVEELKKDDSPVPPASGTKQTPLPRVVSFETSVFYEHSRMREQKSFDSEFGSRPESELKELESRPHSISESLLSRSDSEDQREMYKEDVSDSEMGALLKVIEPFARPYTPEPPEKVVVKDTVVFSEDALGEADIAFSQHFTAVLDEPCEEAEIVPEVEIMTAVELDDGSDLIVGSPPMVSRPLGVKYWPPSGELNLEDDGVAPVDKQIILRSESDDYTAEEYSRQMQVEPDRDIEDRKKWLESQFDEENGGGEGDGFPFMFSQPLDQIVEEEDEHDSMDDGTERELRKLKESLSSTPDFDNVHVRRHIALRGDKDDVSMSSLQEFERLEREVALRGSGSGSRGSLGSQDSLEVLGSSNGRTNGSNSFSKMATKSGTGDDVSIDSHTSLQEFEKMEQACSEAEKIEKIAKEQEEVLSEIEEGHESQISESDSCETLSEAGKSDNSDDYEQRMFQIDEIIKQAQSNVEMFQEKQKKAMQESVEMLPLDEILGWTDSRTESSFVDKTASVGSADSDSLEGDPVPDLPEEFSSYAPDVMQSSIDSLELKMKNNGSKIMQTSTDSLDLRTGQMVLSTDSIELDAPVAFKQGLMTESTDSLEGGAQALKSSYAHADTSQYYGYTGGATALITSTDSLESSCSNNTRATASMLSSLTSNTSDTLLAELEYDSRGQYTEAKKFLLSQGEIPLEDSDESISSNVMITTTKTVMHEKKLVISEQSKSTKDRDEASYSEIEKFDSSCEQMYEEIDEFGNRKQIIIKRSVEPFCLGPDATDIVAQRRLQQGLGAVSQAIFRDL